jgi:hypothetical protein
MEEMVIQTVCPKNYIILKTNLASSILLTGDSHCLGSASPITVITGNRAGSSKSAVISMLVPYAEKWRDGSNTSGRE